MTKLVKITFLLALLTAFAFPINAGTAKDGVKIRPNQQDLKVAAIIYVKGYSSIDSVEEYCGAENMSDYLELAEKTFDILHYREIEEQLEPDDVKMLSLMAAQSFEKKKKILNDRDMFCAFTNTAPYDAMVEAGLDLMNMLQDEIKDTYAQDIYEDYKKTIISYIPKMSINYEQKTKIRQSVEKFE